MVHFVTSSFALAALAILPLAASAPSPAPAFTISQWIEDLVSSPATALSVENATIAFLDAHSSSSSSAVRSRSTIALDKRQDCYPHTLAPVAGAVWCINALASRGTIPLTIDNFDELCHYGGARLTGTGVGGSATSAHVDVARGFGYIMDACTRGDYTGGAHTAHGNGSFRIGLSAL